MSLSNSLHHHCLVLVKPRKPSQNDGNSVDWDVKPQTNKAMQGSPKSENVMLYFETSRHGRKKKNRCVDFQFQPDLNQITFVSVYNSVYLKYFIFIFREKYFHVCFII